MSEGRAEKIGWPRRSLEEIVAVMVEHGMSRAEAMRAIADPDLIPEDVRRVLRQGGV